MPSGVLTQSEVHFYLESALAKIGTVKGDRLLWGNREASWTLTERAYRFDPTGSGPAEGYRHRPGSLTQWTETIVVHLCHRMAADESRTKLQAGQDLEAVRLRLLTDTGIRSAGVRVYVEPASVALSDSGDTLETDLPIRVVYAYQLTEVT